MLIYKIKKADADNAEEEFTILQHRNTQIATFNQLLIDSIRSHLTTQISNLEEPNFKGFAARLESLDRIGSKS